MECRELVAEVLNSLNIPRSGDCKYSNHPSTSQDSIPLLCKKLGLKKCGDNFAAAVSYAALTQVLQHVTGMGMSSWNIDFSGRL